MARPHAELHALPATEQVPSGESAAPARLVALDVFRGLAILAVVFHHLTGLALSHAGGHPLLGEGLAIVNRALHFVVPAFLFMTAVVLTRSALRRFEVGRYYWSRVQSALLPYVVWTALYALFRVYSDQDGPGVLHDPQRWQVWLQYGKGYFHLYFLLIVLQFYLVLPLLLPLWRRRPPFVAVLVAAVALQLLVYALNRADVLNFRFPGTMALWYIPALTLGMYFGANYAQFEGFWRRYQVWLVGAALCGLVWYVPLSVAALRGAEVSTFAYSAANWAYTTAMALGLFGVSHVLAGGSGRLRAALGYLGTVSLQVYLLHPALLLYLDRLGFPSNTGGFVAVLLGYAVVALGVPMLAARALAGTALSRWLFGR